MHPHLDGTGFGWIEIDGQRYEHDVLIRLSGAIKKRKKKLSKEVYGTSHIVSLQEAKHVYEDGAEVLVLGSGQHGCVELSDEAAEYFARHGCRVRLHPTPDALAVWNAAPRASIGLVHVTC
ncbi:MAG: MTH938/NDUFAF3 family protein [Gemmatimonadota bacterium]